MRLGGYVFGYTPDAKGYVSKLKEKNYKAAYCPDYLVSSDQEDEIRDLKEELERNDIVLAEVGAWSNPFSPDEGEAREAKDHLIDRLLLAEKLEARCCVNIIGTVSPVNWYAPDAGNFTDEFMERAVSLYQEVVDEVKPSHTRMALEIMPFNFLDSVDSYVKFLDRMDRESVGVHLDLINLIHDPRTLYEHRDIFRDAVRRLGSRCASAHLKDIIIDKRPFNTCMKEVMIGTGEADVHLMASLLDSIPGDLPVMMEHLENEAEYDQATHNFTRIARKAGVKLNGGF